MNLLQVAEALPSTLRSGNLSVLKKRWEQQQQQQQPPSSSHRSQATPCSYTDPTPTPRSQLSLDQDAEPETQVHSEISESTSNQLQSAHPEDLTDMEARPGRDPEGKEGTAAAEVPECEKPSVPLNSLKMMFEKGENLTDKVSLILPFLIGDGDRQGLEFVLTFHSTHKDLQG